MSRQPEIKHVCFILGTSLCKIPCVSSNHSNFSITVKSPLNVFLSGGMNLNTKLRRTSNAINFTRGNGAWNYKFDY